MGHYIDRCIIRKMDIAQWQAAIGLYYATTMSICNRVFLTAMHGVTIFMFHFGQICRVDNNTQLRLLMVMPIILLLSGDVERNPGPGIGMYCTYTHVA